MKWKEKFTELTKKYKHALVFLYILVYMPWFMFLEKHVTTQYHVIQTTLDEYIPFIEYFIIPYLLWFVFIAVVTLLCAPQSCINLCIVQMLLSAVPERGRSLIVSLYTIVVTLSNSLMPLFGVQLYTWWGADAQSLLAVNLCVFAWRAVALTIFVLRWRRLRA